MKLHSQEKIYKALAHERRLEILRLLKINKYLTVGNIARAMDGSMQTISKHLHILAHAHIIDREKQGLEVYYSIKKPTSPIIRSTLTFL